MARLEITNWQELQDSPDRKEVYEIDIRPLRAKNKGCFNMDACIGTLDEIRGHLLNLNFGEGTEDQWLILTPEEAELFREAKNQTLDDLKIVARFELNKLLVQTDMHLSGRKGADYTKIDKRTAKHKDFLVDVVIEEEDEEDIVIEITAEATFKDLREAIYQSFATAEASGADNPDEANDLLWSEIHDWRDDLSERLFDLLCDSQHAAEAANIKVLDFFAEQGESRGDVEVFLPIKFI